MHTRGQSGQVLNFIIHTKKIIMKTQLLFIVYWITLTCYAINTNAQANRQLSNLSPTAVNQSLLSGTDNTISLGSISLKWKNIHLGNALYLKGTLTLHAPGTTNFFAGGFAGNVLVTGSYNTGIGQNALNRLTSGSANTASGFSSLYANTTGYANTASGSSTLKSNTTGYGNTATGSSALNSNTTGYSNTGNGTNSLYSNTSACCNTAGGYYSLFSNTTGSNNTAIGLLALYSNTTGFWNTANGVNSLRNNNGYYNTAVGGSALWSNTTGALNTALGTGTDVSTGNLTNATAIGYLAIVNASNRVRIGNTSVTSIGGQVGWSIFSDGRYKRDIKENVAGLAFINSLRPVTYTVNVQGLNEYFNKGRKQVSDNAISDIEDETANAEMKKAEEASAKIVYNGFIAQEVEEAAKKLNFEFSGVDKPQNVDGLYSLRYDNFVVPLVKAVQELSKMSEGLLAENDEKDTKINNLQKQIDELKALVLSNNQNNTFSRTETNKKITSAFLAQNVPNPFVNTTTISYSLPPKFTSAQIIITDKNGKQLKQLNISGSSNGALNIDASTLSSGTYNYSLIIDGKIITTKQMMVIK